MISEPTDLFGQPVMERRADFDGKNRLRLSIEVADLLAAKVSATPAAGGDQLDMFGGKA